MMRGHATLHLPLVQANIYFPYYPSQAFYAACMWETSVVLISCFLERAPVTKI